MKNMVEREKAEHLVRRNPVKAEVCKLVAEALDNKIGGIMYPSPPYELSRVENTVFMLRVLSEVGSAKMPRYFEIRISEKI